MPRARQALGLLETDLRRDTAAGNQSLAVGSLQEEKPPIAVLGDEELVERIIAGEKAAFEQLMRRYNQRLFRVARSVMPDEHEVEDIVQETYLRALKHLLRLRGRAHVATWLTRVAFHESLRRKRRRQRSLSRLRGLGMSGPRTEAPGAEHAAALVERRSMLVGAIDALPEVVRTIVVLRLVEGLSTRETAECLKLTESNVKVSLHRGRQLLADKMQDPSDDELPRQFVFGADRCNRVVAAVLDRLDTPR
jgi:RNA polymerase sigma-70 factor, ECF subfamily